MLSLPKGSDLSSLANAPAKPFHIRLMIVHHHHLLLLLLRRRRPHPLHLSLHLLPSVLTRLHPTKTPHCLPPPPYQQNPLLLLPSSISQPFNCLSSLLSILLSTQVTRNQEVFFTIITRLSLPLSLPILHQMKPHLFTLPPLLYSHVLLEKAIMILPLFYHLINSFHLDYRWALCTIH